MWACAYAREYTSASHSSCGAAQAMRAWSMCHHQCSFAQAMRAWSMCHHQCSFAQAMRAWSMCHHQCSFAPSTRCLSAHSSSAAGPCREGGHGAHAPQHMHMHCPALQRVSCLRCLRGIECKTTTHELGLMLRNMRTCSARPYSSCWKLAGASPSSTVFLSSSPWVAPGRPYSSWASLRGQGGGGGGQCCVGP